MSIFKMAWRNVWRDRRRTTVTVGAMTLAFAVMVLYSGLVEGYMVGIERNMLDIELGELQIHHPEYRDDPSLYTRIEEPEKLIAQLAGRGYRASARLLGGGLAAAGDASAGVFLRGLDIERDAGVSQVYLHVEKGAWLDSGRPLEVVVGRRLARTLAIGPGSELVMLGQGADGSIANDLFRVRGVLKAVSDITDRTGIFMTEEAFRAFFVMPQGAHQIIVRTPEGTPLAAATPLVKRIAAGLEVKTWREIVPTLANLLDSTRGLIQIVFFIVYIAIGILILNAMLMAVFERIREFGILKALGVGPGAVLLTILAESGMQTGLAILFGLVLAIPGLWYLDVVGIDVGTLGGMSMMGVAFDPIWRASVSTSTFAGPLIALVVIVMVAVLYPALKAARINPVEAMRHH